MPKPFDAWWVIQHLHGISAQVNKKASENVGSTITYGVLGKKKMQSYEKISFSYLFLWNCVLENNSDTNQKVSKFI